MNFQKIKNEPHLLFDKNSHMELSVTSYWAILYAFLSSILIILICISIIYCYTRRRDRIEPEINEIRNEIIV